ncbi:hypothetical protein MNEG_9715 [Monoraphidium neglectum]|jgi:hypothetical protein|uniref:Uncharacterized protein n=1 Tax=Monoraphidium neglectum TaxID=145388 RepID=A0A0D2MV69_9CHLO|nr:hypothetical protein MNEG_9715 [Monoraphidium neglectum]KIY98245.1 hypothetical protein MNEG_9715 [Monoraphidium neglectum]|eukprot:XP_013897265.1 hypothetical protein MNEG_9715 [Monoraphidium neglectum]
MRFPPPFQVRYLLWSYDLPLVDSYFMLDCDEANEVADNEVSQMIDFEGALGRPVLGIDPLQHGSLHHTSRPHGIGSVGVGVGDSGGGLRQDESRPATLNGGGRGGPVRLRRLAREDAQLAMAGLEAR